MVDIHRRVDSGRRDTHPFTRHNQKRGAEKGDIGETFVFAAVCSYVSVLGKCTQSALGHDTHTPSLTQPGVGSSRSLRSLGDIVSAHSTYHLCQFDSLAMLDGRRFLLQFANVHADRCCRAGVCGLAAAGKLNRRAFSVLFGRESSICRANGHHEGKIDYLLSISPLFAG